MRRRRKRAQSEYINVATIGGDVGIRVLYSTAPPFTHKEHVLDGDAFPILLQTTSFFFSSLLIVSVLIPNYDASRLLYTDMQIGRAFLPVREFSASSRYIQQDKWKRKN